MNKPQVPDFFPREFISIFYKWCLLFSFWFHLINILKFRLWAKITRYTQDTKKISMLNPNENMYLLYALLKIPTMQIFVYSILRKAETTPKLPGYFIPSTVENPSPAVGQADDYVTYGLMLIAHTINFRWGTHRDGFTLRYVVSALHTVLHDCWWSVANKQARHNNTNIIRAKVCMLSVGLLLFRDKTFARFKIE